MKITPDRLYPALRQYRRKRSNFDDLLPVNEDFITAFDYDETCNVVVKLEADLNRIGAQVDKIRYACDSEIERAEVAELLNMFDEDSGELLPEGQTGYQRG